MHAHRKHPLWQSVLAARARALLTAMALGAAALVRRLGRLLAAVAALVARTRALPGALLAALAAFVGWLLAAIVSQARGVGARRPSLALGVRPRWLLTRGFPAAAVVGAVVLAAALLPGIGEPRQEVLGVSATEAPAGPPAATVAAVVAAGGDIPAIPDPGGQAAIPDIRIPTQPASLTGYRWPIRHGRLTLPFGPSPWGSRIVDGKRFHDGIDIATFCWDKVTAAHDGVVLAAGRRYDAFVGWRGDLAPYTARLNEKGLWGTLPIAVVIDDGNGYRSIYAHFARIVVKKGQVVKAGQFLGYEGATGRASGCHLHYGLFNPDEVASFTFDPVAAAHMLLPTEEVARVDPLLVLPPMASAGIR